MDLRRPRFRLLLSLLLLTPGPPLLAELPLASTDTTTAVGYFELSFGGSLGLIGASGSASVRRGEPTPSGPGMEISTELVNLKLSSFVFGSETIVRLSPTNPSTGAIRTPGGGVEAPAESFFDVWLEIEIPDLGVLLTSAEPIQIAGTAESIPMRQILVSPPGRKFKLLEGDVFSGWELGHLAINLNPEVLCFQTQTPDPLTTTSMRWTLPEGEEEIALTGRWTFVRALSSAPVPPGASSTYNSELLAMVLTGTSRFRGPIRLIERPETISPGQMILYETDPIYLVSYRAPFRGFFEIRDERGGVYLNVDPLVASGTILPLDGESVFRSLEPVKLLEAPGGNTVAVLESFLWWGDAGISCCRDSDRDGAALPPCDNDCDDSDPNNFPGNLESCADNRDNNCDQRPDCLEAVCQAQACNDSSECTSNDVCHDFSCVGQPRDCNDNDACTLDRCEPATGVCQHPPVGPPGQSGPVRFTGPDTLEWSPAPDAPMSNTYRGRIPSVGGMSSLGAGPYTHVCFESGDAQGNGATRTDDADEMRPGEIRYYLVSGETGCGEGPLGPASNGTPRPNPFPCPTPPP